jgi:hypothetical protein
MPGRLSYLTEERIELMLVFTIPGKRITGKVSAGLPVDWYSYLASRPCDCVS